MKLVDFIGIQINMRNMCLHSFRRISTQHDFGFYQTSLFSFIALILLLITAFGSRIVLRLCLVYYTLLARVMESLRGFLVYLCINASWGFLHNSASAWGRIKYFGKQVIDIRSYIIMFDINRVCYSINGGNSSKFSENHICHHFWKRLRRGWYSLQISPVTNTKVPSTFQWHKQIAV